MIQDVKTYGLVKHNQRSVTLKMKQLLTYKNTRIFLKNSKQYPASMNLCLIKPPKQNSRQSTLDSSEDHLN